MSREIDERIVAMYLDNSDFERNAQKTIKTLEELKNSTNLEGASKGFQVFDKVKSQLNSVDDSAIKVKKTFSSFGDAIKNGVDKVEGPLKRLRGYIAKAIGFDIGHKIVSNFENAVRSLTVAPISAGWNQYEASMDSIKTIMSSTGENLDTVKAKMRELTEYANQTVFSLSDMTNNIGKFTNNKVPLEDATKAMIGLANATASAGQGSQQASMVMYNASQAIGVGKMTSIDWKSFENANIATSDFKQTLIDSAVAAGQLEKKITKVTNQNGDVEEQVTYWTKAEKGVKATEVTVENFRDTLSKGWLDKESMMIGFQIYGGMTWQEIKKLGDFTDEEAQRLELLGQKAMEAASEVRTFSKMMDALKESVQSNIATSYEYIFGDLEEGTSLWTEVNEQLEAILNDATYGINDLLLSWRGMMYDSNGDVKRIEEVYNNEKNSLEAAFKAGYISDEMYHERLNQLNERLGDKSLWVDYRDMFVESLMDAISIVIDLLKTLGGAFQDAFGKFDLKSITQGISNFIGSIRTWLGDLNDADSRISKIRKVIAGLLIPLKLGWNILRSIANVLISILKPILAPILDLIINIGSWLDLGPVSKLGDIIEALGRKFGILWSKLTSLGWRGVFEKIGGWISNLYTNIKTNVVAWLNDNGLSGVVDWFRGIRDSIAEGWGAVQSWWGQEGNIIRETFEAIWGAVSGLFQGQQIEGKQGNSWTDDPPIVKFFNRIWEWISGTWDSIWSDFNNWWKGGDNDVINWLVAAWDKVAGLRKKAELRLLLRSLNRFGIGLQVPGHRFRRPLKPGGKMTVMLL